MSNMNNLRGNIPNLLPGQTRIYPRKSTATDRAKKTIDDQVAESMETCAEWGIPVSEDDVRAEEPGHGGDEWYKPHPELGLWAPEGGRTRLMLTDIMVGIARGEVKCVVCWSLDRMWRDVGICEAVIKFMAEHGCMLVDRNGPVDISTAHGRQAVRNAAVAAQNYRETIAESSPRGIKRSIAKGENVCNPNTLGFRGGGRYSKIVRHVPEEQEVVRRIFRLFSIGEGEQGPQSCDQIAARLIKEQYQWTSDLQPKRGKKRHEGTAHIIYDWQVKRVLMDCRYQGRQRQYKQEYDCALYLVDGQPVVDIALFERVKEKIKGNKRGGNAASKKRALSGLMRCGLCAQGLQAANVQIRYADGRMEKIPYWNNPKK
jgi:DNA invertase Pin-like site-specific DNA recombinase